VNYKLTIKNTNRQLIVQEFDRFNKYFLRKLVVCCISKNPCRAEALAKAGG